MKRVYRIALMAFAAISSISVYAQKETVVYALPSTTITFNVVAEKEEFVAGPYAQYAQKYMGSDARREDGVTYTLKSIAAVPYIEADQSVVLTFNLGTKDNAMANFMKLCSQGLVIMQDSYAGKTENWRFPSIADNDQFAGKGVDGNLTNATATLYQNVKTDAGFQRVAVSQTQVVEKSLERKAEETAATIFNLRRKRIDIITGDTDATYSGEAMKAAIDEIARLEEEYMSLFYGVSVKSQQQMSFDVVPTADQSRQMYVAFRLSDTQGLLPANNVAGRPITLELSLDEKEKRVQTSSNNGNSIFYRSPAIATARVMDGQNLLMQTRIPIYQLGQTITFPVSTIILK